MVTIDGPCPFGDEPEKENEEKDEEDPSRGFGPVWCLLNAVCMDDDRLKPRTRGNLRIAAEYATELLVLRGYVCDQGDADTILSQLLELPAGDVPDEALWLHLAEGTRREWKP